MTPRAQQVLDHLNFSDETLICLYAHSAPSSLSHRTSFTSFSFALHLIFFLNLEELDHMSRCVIHLRVFDLVSIPYLKRLVFGR